MRIVLLRVGADTGTCGIHGPLLRDSNFEYIPIPDRYQGTGIDSRTYGTTPGRHGRNLIEYFPGPRKIKFENQPIHFDPEFETYTYGDPTPPKARLRTLEEGDLLAFYAGLEGWECDIRPALYIIGIFTVAYAGLATDFSEPEIKSLFDRNFHVRHRVVFEDQKHRLALVKGDASNSRLLEKAVPISAIGENRGKKPLQILSPAMQKIFGSFQGHTSIQRSPPRWVASEFIPTAAEFLRALLRRNETEPALTHTP